MKLLTALAVVIFLVFAAAPTASAGQAQGTTKILPVDEEALANTPTDVDVSITGGAPIVPYEYSIVNRCWFFSSKTSGPSDSYERFDIIGPWFEDGGGTPHTTVTVNNNPVPAGATCKVSIVHGNPMVKGSTTIYTVVP